MDNTIVRLFERTADAEAARNALLEAGFSPDDVQLGSLMDEAGPVEGNFYVGNADIETPGQKAGGNDAGSYRRNFDKVEWRGHYVLTVEAGEEQRAQAAAVLMDRFGALDADPAARRTAGPDGAGLRR
jgi:hypothetical protein